VTADSVNKPQPTDSRVDKEK